MEKQKDRTSAKNFSRKAKTYAEQVALIRKKGFIVDDESECAEFLRKVNYSGLTAYFQPFRCTNGKYLPNIPFRKIGRIYEFDRKISVVLFECIGEIERYLRSQFAYFSGHRHGAFEYLNESMYSDSHNHENFLERVRARLKEHRRILLSLYHDEQHESNFPIWVTIEFFSMGMLSYFYKDLKSKDQKALAKAMYGAGTLPIRLITWLRCITELRNCCAHYSRLYYWSFPALPKVPRETAFTVDHKLFTQIMVLKLLYPEPGTWNSNTLAKIETLLAEYSEDISLEHIGFPENWRELLQHRGEEQKVRKYH